VESKNTVKITGILIFLLLIILIVIEPKICKTAAVNGILLCGRVIIPSLFPFTACVLFIMKSGITEYMNKFSHITRKIFGLSAELVFMVMFSFIGGYAVGAKLLNTAVTDKKITSKQAGKMLNYCINAGPAFIVAAVGNGILGSKRIGYILLISHIIPSIIFMFILKGKNIIKTNKTIKKELTFSDCFVQSVSEASTVSLNICSFVLFFSVIVAYIENFSTHFRFLKYITYFLEITIAIPKINNIYFISFLLGFSGLCVWCQIISIGKNIKINILSFALFRILHATVSFFLTIFLLKLFKISEICISNNTVFSHDIFYSTPALSLSLVIMGILFIISLTTKKHTGNFIEDVI